MSIQTLASHSNTSIYTSCTLDDLMLQVDSIIAHAFSDQVDTLPEANICIEAVRYHFAKAGQQVRAKICLDACLKLGVSYDDMLQLAAVAELLHNASLIHDDIQDKDEIRRNQASVWKKFGDSIAICVGDLMLSTAFGLLAGYNNVKLLPKLISTVHRQTKSTIEGQSNDIAYKNNQHISIEQYVQIATQKSGALLSLPLELALIAGEQNEFITLAKKATSQFAVGYQIADDLEDITKDVGIQNSDQAVNITFVLKSLGHAQPQQVAISMCHYYLSQAINDAQQLPNGSGKLLIHLAETLKNKISHLTQL